EYQFNNCSFDWDGYTLITFDQNKKISLFQVNNSIFASRENTAFLFRDVGGEVIFTNNSFNYNPTNSGTMIDFWWPTFVGKSLILVGNIFRSEKLMKAINANDPKSAATEIIFNNNIVKTAKIEILEHPKHIKINNYIDGFVDPYYNLAAPPTSGSYRRGQVIYNSSPVSGSYIGWVSTAAGTAEDTAWVADTSYVINTFIYSNGKVYKSNTAGKSGKVAPSHNSGTSTDGSVIWEFVDVLAEFKPFGLIS
ncbi:right-handed parallel beta-helix repeat-containing protein, partial [Paenibacillus sp. TAF58]